MCSAGFPEGTRQSISGRSLCKGHERIWGIRVQGIMPIRPDKVPQCVSCLTVCAVNAFALPNRCRNGIISYGKTNNRCKGGQ